MRNQTATMERVQAPRSDVHLEMLWRHREGEGYTLTDKERSRLLGEFVAPDDVAPYSPELQIAYSEWFSGVAKAAKACRTLNEEIVAKDPERYVMIGNFVCERTVPPFSAEREY